MLDLSYQILMKLKLDFPRSLYSLLAKFDFWHIHLLTRLDFGTNTGAMQNRIALMDTMTLFGALV